MPRGGIRRARQSVTTAAIVMAVIAGAAVIVTLRWPEPSAADDRLPWGLSAADARHHPWLASALGAALGDCPADATLPDSGSSSVVAAGTFRCAVAASANRAGSWRARVPDMAGDALFDVTLREDTSDVLLRVVPAGAGVGEASPRTEAVVGRTLYLADADGLLRGSGLWLQESLDSWSEASPFMAQRGIELRHHGSLLALAEGVRDADVEVVAVGDGLTTYRVVMSRPTFSVVLGEAVGPQESTSDVVTLWSVDHDGQVRSVRHEKSEVPNILFDQYGSATLVTAPPPARRVTMNEVADRLVADMP